MFRQLNGHNHILIKCENASVSVNSTKLLKLTWIKLDSEYQILEGTVNTMSSGTEWHQPDFKGLLLELLYVWTIKWP